MTEKTPKLLSPGIKPAFLFLLSLLMYPALIYAQSGLSLWGYITDSETGLPVEDAIVRLIPEGRTTNTDKDGRYRFFNLKYESATIEIKAEGYESLKREGLSLDDDLASRQDFALESRLFYDQDQIVVGEVEVEHPGKIIIDESSPEFKNARTLSEILEYIPRVIVAQSGGSNQTASISIGGAPAKHTGIYIDGMPVNSHLTGEFDLNSIPRQAVKRIEVYTDGAGAEMGAGSLAGAVNIITRKASFQGEFRFDQNIGSYNSDETNLTVQNIFHEKLSGLFIFSRNTASNDFKYDDPKAGEIRRQNNYRDLDSKYASLNYKISRHENIYMNFSYVGSRAGLPGAVYSLTPSAEKSESFRTWNLGADLSPLENLKLAVSTQHYLSHQHFTDYDTFIPYDSKYRDSRRSLNINPKYIINPNHYLSTRLNLSFDRFRQEYMLNEDQKPIEVNEDRIQSNISYDGRMELESPALFFDYLNLKLAFSQTASDLYRPLMSPLIRADLEKGKYDKIILHAAYANSYRAPTYASLFWSEDAFSVGNPNLLPEKSEDFSTGLRFIFRRSGIWKLGVEYEHSFIKDLIYWERRFDGKYMPRNLSAARVSSVRWNAEWKSFDDIAGVSLSHTLSDPRDRSWEPNQHDNILTFHPRKITDLKLSFNPGAVFVSMQTRWVSERYIRRANTKALGKYSVTDLMTGV
ncbi:MAG: TonB-dependent receptor, partial [candidate division Zixibacteria bacterium]|nr:TonB-dependent receptor [candidate division Zixibacteria bacterium]